MEAPVHDDARPWVRQTDGRYHCSRHEITFHPSSPCRGCASDPGPAPADLDDLEAPTPVGCLSAHALELQMVDDLDALRGLRTRLANKKKIKELGTYNTIAKLSDAIVKLQRALAERIQRRDDEWIVRSRERRLRKRDGASH